MIRTRRRASQVRLDGPVSLINECADPRKGQHYAARNQIPSPSDTSYIGLPLRRLEGHFARWLEPLPIALPSDGGEFSPRRRSRTRSPVPQRGIREPRLKVSEYENSSRTLVRRLKRLEDRMIPTGEPTIINVSYVNPDGTRAPGGIHGRRSYALYAGPSAKSDNDAFRQPRPMDIGGEMIGRLLTRRLKQLEHLEQLRRAQMLIGFGWVFGQPSVCLERRLPAFGLPDQDVNLLEQRDGKEDLASLVIRRPTSAAATPSNRMNFFMASGCRRLPEVLHPPDTCVLAPAPRSAGCVLSRAWPIHAASAPV